MMKSWRIGVVAVAALGLAAFGSVGCGDDDDDNGGGSSSNGGSSSGQADTVEQAKAMEGEFMGMCGDFHAKCVGGEGVEPEQYEEGCNWDFEDHLDVAADPLACVEARIAQWECLYEPCPTSEDEPDRCQDENIARGAACNPPHDGPGNTNQPSVDKEDYVNMCANYVNTCGEDGELGSESDCVANWYSFEANARDFGGCIEAQIEGWDCMLAEGCDSEDAGMGCMENFQEIGDLCYIFPE